MKDGFYISAFIAAGELQSALDIKLRHDQTFALWEKKGDKIELKKYWELERYSGFKQHTFTFYSKEEVLKVLAFLLEKEGLGLNDIVEIWGSPIIDTVSDYSSEDIYPDLAYHSICHIFTSILFNSAIAKEGEILAFSFDSGPDNLVQLEAYHKKYYAGCYVNRGKLTFFPIESPGKIWSNSKKKFGLREGSLMALASATSARTKEEYQEHVSLMDETALENALSYLMQLERFVKRVGYTTDDRFTQEENYISAFMKIVDEESTNIVYRVIERTILEYGIKPNNAYLGLSGGFALNCPTNSKVMNKYRFKGLIAPPCTSDCGQALGIGLFSFYKKMGKIPEVEIKNPFYGNDCGTITHAVLNEFGDFIDKIEEFDMQQVVKDLSEDVIVWMQGKSEIGPRALGHRSLLCTSTKSELKEKINFIKKRQWWRPVAPIVLAEYADLLFEKVRESPFMLETFYVREEMKDKVPAIVHLDGSARVQTLTKQDNELLYLIIQEFYRRYGIPAICNTSLNDSGEPIIQTIEEAFNFALRKGLSIIYVNGTRIKLKAQREYNEEHPRKRTGIPYRRMDQSKINAINRKRNPFGLDKDTLTYYYDNPEMYLKYSLMEEEDVKEIRRCAEIFKKKFLISLQRDLL